MNIPEILTTAAVTGVVQLAIWFTIRRQMEQQDARLLKQEQELQHLRDDRLAQMQRQITERVHRSEFDITTSNMEKRMEAGSAIHKEMREDMSYVKQRLAGIEKFMELIATAVKLRFPGTTS